MPNNGSLATSRRQNHLPSVNLTLAKKAISRGIVLCLIGEFVTPLFKQAEGEMYLLSTVKCCLFSGSQHLYFEMPDNMGLGNLVNGTEQREQNSVQN